MRFFLSTLLLAVLCCGCPVNEPVTPEPPAPQPAPVSDLQTEMRALVKDIEPVSVPELAQFYRDYADIVVRDTKVIRNTGDIRESHKTAGQLCFQGTDLIAKTPGLSAKVDKAVADAIGLQNRELTPELRARAVAIFEAIGWAVE